MSAVRIKVASVKHETEKAKLIVTEDGDEHWIPDSQIEADYDEKLGSMWVSKWVAEQKDLEYE